MSILAQFGLPSEKILKVSLGSDIFYAAKVPPQLYGTYEPISFDYSDETYVSFEFYIDNDDEQSGQSGYHYSRFYITAYKKYPAIPKIPAPYVAKVSSSSTANDGDPPGTYSKPSLGAPATGTPIQHSGPNHRFIRANNPRLTTEAELAAWILDKKVYMQRYTDLSSEQYDAKYMIPRDAVLSFLADWSGGPSYYPNVAQGYTIEYGVTKFSGAYGASAAVNLSNASDLQGTAVPKRVVDDSDLPPVHPYNVGIGSGTLEDFYSRWSSERKDAVDRERTFCVENSDRVVGFLKAGIMPAEIAHAVLEKKPSFMESRLDSTFKITVGDIEVLQDAEVSGDPNPRKNHPARGYFYTPAILVKYKTPGYFGSTWSTGAREKISAELSFTVKLRRKVTIEFTIMDKTLNPPEPTRKVYEYVGELAISQSYPYADYPNAGVTSYLFNRWPLIGEDGLAPYYGEFAELLDSLYEMRPTEVSVASMAGLAYIALEAKNKRTEERDAAQAALNAVLSSGDSAAIASMQAALNRAEAALSAATNLYSSIAGNVPTGSAAAKEVTAFINTRVIDKFGEGLYSASLISGVFSVDYAMYKAPNIKVGDIHPVRNLSRVLRSYHTKVAHELEAAIEEDIAAQQTDDADRKSKASQAKAAAIAAETYIRGAINSSVASESLGDTVMVNTLHAEQVPALQDYARLMPSMSRGYYDI